MASNTTGDWTENYAGNGRVYRPADFCGLIWNTVMEWGPQGVQIDDAERNYIKVLKAAPLHFLPIDPGSTKGSWERVKEISSKDVSSNRLSHR